MLDGGEHEVAHVVAEDAVGDPDEAHRLPVAAVEGGGDADALAVAAGDLESVRAPARVALRHGDAAVVAPLVGSSGVAGQEQAMGLHHAPDALVVGRRLAVLLRPAAYLRLAIWARAQVAPLR